MTEQSINSNRGTHQAAGTGVTGAALPGDLRPPEIEIKLENFLQAARDLSESRFGEDWILGHLHYVEKRFVVPAGTLRHKLLTGALYKKKEGRIPSSESFQLAVLSVRDFVDELRSAEKIIEGDGSKLTLDMGDMLALHLTDRVRVKMLECISGYIRQQSKFPTDRLKNAIAELPDILEGLKEVKDWQTRVAEKGTWRLDGKGVGSSLKQMIRKPNHVSDLFGRGTRACVGLLVNIMEISENGLGAPQEPVLREGRVFMPKVVSTRPVRRTH